MEPLRFGVRLSSLQTERTGKGSLGAIPEVSCCSVIEQVTCMASRLFIHGLRPSVPNTFCNATKSLSITMRC